jgi:hypothetical protein
MSYVYICHSIVNIAPTKQVRDFLISKGFDVWNYDVGSGDANGDRKAIDDCGAFIVMMSAQAYADTRVQQESQHAEHRKKNIVPVLVEGEVFPRYKRVPHIDLRNGKKPPDSLLALLGGAERGKKPGKLVPVGEDSEQSGHGHMTTLARPKELQKLAEAMRTGLSKTSQNVPAGLTEQLSKSKSSTAKKKK